MFRDRRVQPNAAGQVELKRKTPWRDGTTHLVPRHRMHLIRFHGVLALNAKLRSPGVSQEPEAPAQSVAPAECEVNFAHHRALREHCLNCGGELKIIVAILEPPVIEKTLTHLGLQARAPPRTPPPRQALQGA